jgi:hypothetical protein
VVLPAAACELLGGSATLECALCICGFGIFAIKVAYFVSTRRSGT